MTFFTKILSPWPWSQGHPWGGDGADKNFRPISTIMPYMNEIHRRVFKIWGLINFNTKTLTLWLFYENSKSWPWPQGHPRGGDGADKNFRPISTIMPNMNEIHQRVFKIWGLINFNAKILTLWRKDERTNERTNERTDERKSENYIPPHTSYVGGIIKLLAYEEMLFKDVSIS